MTPTATYRFQFHKGFPFADGEAVVPYLAELGISDVYSSPILQAAPGSTHGYDVCDPSRVNAELGGEEAFARLADAAKSLGLGMIVDTVPNHMSVGDPSNRWWADVLENGLSSRHAGHFDIDFAPVNPNLAGRVLLPILGDHYGRVLESGEIRVEYDAGGFVLLCHDARLPVAPRSAEMILRPAVQWLEGRLGPEDDSVQELLSVITALHHLPPRARLAPEIVELRYREKDIARRRVRQLCESVPEARAAIDYAVGAINGVPGEPATFDALHQLVEAQAYRPAFWRVAGDDINYRRFFDINSLAAIRVERPEVFDATHAVALRLIEEGRVTGLRVDHPDGLWDPTEYFLRLQERSARKPLYVVAEKILSDREPLPKAWQVAGTVGYDFLSSVGGLFVDGDNEQAFTELYEQFIGHPMDYPELVRSCKLRVMRESMASEVQSLSHQLDRITERSRRYRDYTLPVLQWVVREEIAAMQIYRTYVRPGEPPTARDLMYWESAVAEAKRRSPGVPVEVFDFVRDTILLRNLGAFTEDDRAGVTDWAMRFQQMTGPIMAKGVEDTAFYVYNRLVALNEVGGHPERFGTPVEEFHRHNAERRRDWPAALLAGSTHDTKRSEDVRSRLAVLSEMPREWGEAVRKWDAMTAPHRDGEWPTANDRYLFFQSLVGAWPATLDVDDYRSRMVAYMEKATHEAKVHTSWLNPDPAYDAAVRVFVEGCVNDESLRREVAALVEQVKMFGYINSLSQLVLRLTCPGVPDIYQGTELWDFSLVDPDNRRPVDYDRRRRALEEVRRADGPEAFLASPDDGRMKLWTLYRLLQFRRGAEELFREGDYRPLHATGNKSKHVISFARTVGDRAVVVAVPRLVRTLGDWGDTAIEWAAPLRNVLTGDVAEGGSAAAMFRRFPVFVGEGHFGG